MPAMTKFHFQTLEIPMRVTFKHASASRNVGHSLWVEAVSDAGIIGYGESCPREYVTGETYKTARKFYQRFEEQWIAEINSIDTLRAWVSQYTEIINRNPAAWCAVEMAIIDCLAREEKKSWESVLGVEELEGTFHYTAVLGDQDEATFKKQLAQYHDWGFTGFKVKLSGDPKRDAAKQATLQADGIRGSHLRWDANNLWADRETAAAHLLRLDGFAVEEPLCAGDFEGMRRMVQQTGKKIILDESIIHKAQLQELHADPECWIINLRISKMGGLLRSLNVARIAGELQIPIIIGAQVGETSLLSRAALTVAHAHRENLLAQEGAFGTRLLEHDICSPPVMFGEDGQLAVNKYDFKHPVSVIRPDAWLSSLTE